MERVSNPEEWELKAAETLTKKKKKADGGGDVSKKCAWRCGLCTLVRKPLPRLHQCKSLAKAQTDLCSICVTAVI